MKIGERLKLVHMNNEIKKAIEIIKQGGIVIYPTDTAFGIGCRIDDEEAIKRLFRIRKRPETQATPVLIDHVSLAEKFVTEIPEEVRIQLIDQYWPGALTIILESKIELIPELVRGGRTSIGMRIPNHKTALTLIHGVGIPLLGPSANFHGEATPYTFADLDPELKKLVDYVVPGECSVKEASTVIDCTVKPWKIVRQGAIKLDL